MQMRGILRDALMLWSRDALVQVPEAIRFVAYLREKAAQSGVPENVVLRSLRSVERAYGVSFGLPVLLRRHVMQPARQAGWAGQARIVFAADAALEATLVRRADRSTDDAALALACAILRGGLIRPDLWPAFLKALQARSPLARSPRLGEAVWMTLQVPRRKDRVAQEDTIETIRFYPDVITLAQMGRAMRTGLVVPIGTPGACLRRAMAAIGMQGVTVQAIAAAGFAAFEDRAVQPVPQVLFEIAAGGVPAVSLTEPVWRRALVGEGKKIPLGPRQSASVRSPATDLSVELSIQQLRAALIAQLPKASKPTPGPVRSALNALIVARPVPVIHALALWLLDLLARRRAVSTIRRYGGALADLMGPLFGLQDPGQLNSGELETLIEDALEVVRPRERIYRAARIAQFFQFAAFDPRLLWPELRLEVEGGERPRIRATWVSPDQLQRLLADLANDQVAYAAALLGVRGGLRLSDMEALCVGDVELGGEGWLRIHQTRWANLKSSSGRRKIPLALLLTPAEHRVWSRFVVSRQAQGQPGAPLLAHMRGFAEIERFDRKEFAAQLGEAGLRPHDLRHAALSNLALTLMAPRSKTGEQITASLTGWRADQRAQIRSWLERGDPLQGMRNLARLAGHRDPATTLQTYIHFSDLALGLHLQADDRRYRAEDVARMLGLNRRSMPKTTTLCPEALRTLILKRLPIEEIRATPLVLAPQSSAQEERLTVDLVIQLMDQIAKGRPTPLIASETMVPLRVVNALVPHAPLPRLKAINDQRAAIHLTTQVLSGPEALVWAEVTLKAPQAGVVLGKGAAALWATPFAPTWSVRQVEQCGGRLRLSPDCPGGMRTTKLAARVVRCWHVAQSSWAKASSTSSG
ncbi:hypothetical protein [Thioclava kandeliae]|uniref:Tyr recombinase domain-containing protein n=1 Tax=Thioclava kandeliae TaxID=3070818 RepID=A0ABV1SMS9_9RHOB